MAAVHFLNANCNIFQTNICSKVVNCNQMAYSFRPKVTFPFNKKQGHFIKLTLKVCFTNNLALWGIVKVSWKPITPFS